MSLPNSTTTTPSPDSSFEKRTPHSSRIYSRALTYTYFLVFRCGAELRQRSHRTFSDDANLLVLPPPPPGREFPEIRFSLRSLTLNLPGTHTRPIEDLGSYFSKPLLHITPEQQNLPVDKTKPFQNGASRQLRRLANPL